MYHVEMNRDGEEGERETPVRLDVFGTHVRIQENDTTLYLPSGTRVLQARRPTSHGLV